MIRDKDLMARLLSDMTCLGMPVDEVDVVLRPYSKTFYGRYFPVQGSRTTPRVFLYPYEMDGSVMCYDKVFETFVHEMVHHLQYTSGNFIRRSGMMHNPQFWKLFNHYKKRAVKYGIMKGAVLLA